MLHIEENSSKLSLPCYTVHYFFQILGAWEFSNCFFVFFGLFFKNHFSSSVPFGAVAMGCYREKDMQ